MTITRARREYMRKYCLEWRTKRRNEWIKANGPCRRCGSSKQLEVDHINPKLKRMQPARIWGLTIKKRLKELAKCQVLCHDCHAAKSAKEREDSGAYDKLRIKAPKGKAWCYRGKHFVPVGEFSKDASKFDGRQDECRTCRSKFRSPRRWASPVYASSP